jgi:hypothetical protein
MKTTLDLPGDVVDDLKLHASSSGTDIDHATTDLLRLGLALCPPPEITSERPRIGADPVTGLPVIQSSGPAPARQMTTAELLALEQAVQTQEDLERHGVFHRQ